MSRPTARVVHLVSRPTGAPTAENFAFLDETVRPLADGEALVENTHQSVDPYMREEMDETGSWQLHAPLEGRALGRVVESRAPSLPVGTLVHHRRAWRTHSVVGAAETTVLPDFVGVPLSAHLGILGGTGLSAWVGLTRVARLQPGETLFVSAAAGGVGTAAGRIARLLGAGRIVGSAGSAAKVEHLTGELGFDAAFDYHDAPIADRLREAAPDGLHVYLDNVGGDHLEAAIGALRDRGRIAWCGAVAQYDRLQDPPAAPATSSTWSARACGWRGSWSATTSTPAPSCTTSSSRTCAPARSPPTRRWSRASTTSSTPSSACSGEPTPAR